MLDMFDENDFRAFENMVTYLPVWLVLRRARVASWTVLRIESEVGCKWRVEVRLASWNHTKKQVRASQNSRVLEATRERDE